MYLKTLEILGFKSFADKTTFEFAEGVTGIVGPNGCGKSNVVDAIRWVLGETSAKALRGGEMADVIFNGTENRKPLGMAEVTLTMADCEESLNVDFNEVAITRRVFRDGRSEYRLNGTLCRLRDFHDLFMDTGIGRTAYSIMAQGQIDQILSSKPEERRAVFEEAAGITKFKREKKEALRKLEYTEANLLRVSDVLAEQERRMNSLKRQVAKARKFQSLSSQHRILDTHLAHKRFTTITAERAELSTSIRSLDAQDSHLSRQLAPAEEGLAESRDAARSFEKSLSSLREELNVLQNTLASAKARISFNLERKIELETRISQNQTEISSTREKLAQQEFDFTAANEALDELSRRLAQQEIALATQEEKNLSSREKRADLESALRDTRTEANKTQTLIASMRAKIESALAQVQGNRDREKKLAEDEQRLSISIQEHISAQTSVSEKITESSTALNSLEESFNSAERDYLHIRADLDSARTAATESTKILAQRSARRDAVQQLLSSGEGLAKGTQNLLKGLDSPEEFKPSILGTIASFLQVNDDSAPAIEAALSTHLQTVLVSDADIAESIITRLTDKKLGVAAVLPANFVASSRASQVETLPPGASSWALDQVKLDPKISSVVTQLLENTAIVPNLETAVALRADHPHLSFVTSTGETLSAQGILQGGSSPQGSNSLLERQNEIRSLKAEVKSLQSSDETARELVSSLEKNLDKQREAVESSRDRYQRQKVNLSTLQGELSVASKEVENFNTRIENVRWERRDLADRETRAATSREATESELSSARERLAETESSLRSLQTQADAAAAAETEHASVLNELRTRLAVEKRAKQAAEEQQRPMEARLSELREISVRREAEIENFTTRITSATTENEALTVQIKETELEIADLTQEISDKSQGRDELDSAIQEAEAKLTKLRRDLSATNEQKGREEIAATKLDLRLENLLTTTEERHQISLGSFQPDTHLLLQTLHNSSSSQPEENKVSDPTETPGEPDWSHIESLTSETKQRIDSMGPVNVDAIEEYDELEERHNFLRSQHDDLVSSKTELLSVIERINDETQRRFSETFAQVRINFRDMFKELFGEKGQADLTLIDENDPLESGIEVIAKPPGKKPQSITLLSGGERSMTAVALLFSIYMIKPSPFCVLDELDAPLDESNINRFVKVLDRFIDRSQFIIVTHSKRTMARADVMYGVTMEEFGVSKPVGMRLTSSSTFSSDTPKNSQTSPAQKAALHLDA